nr:hypothetical protein [Pseudomonas savastanoi]
MQLTIAQPPAPPLRMDVGLHYAQQHLVSGFADIALHHGNVRKHLDSIALTVDKNSGNRFRSAWRGRFEYTVQMRLILATKIQFMTKISELLKVDIKTVLVFHLVPALSTVDKPVTQASSTKYCRVRIEAASVTGGEVLQGGLQQRLFKGIRLPGTVITPGHQLKGFDIQGTFEAFEKRFRQQRRCECLC